MDNRQSPGKTVKACANCAETALSGHLQKLIFLIQYRQGKKFSRGCAENAYKADDFCYRQGMSAFFIAGKFNKNVWKVWILL